MVIQSGLGDSVNPRTFGWEVINSGFISGDMLEGQRKRARETTIAPDPVSVFYMPGFRTAPGGLSFSAEWEPLTNWKTGGEAPNEAWTL
jgi:hypothetical protein